MPGIIRAGPKCHHRHPCKWEAEGDLKGLHAKECRQPPEHEKAKKPVLS